MFPLEKNRECGTIEFNPQTYIQRNVYVSHPVDWEAMKIEKLFTRHT